MSEKESQPDVRFDTLKNESARQRWQLFHRAIAHAKQSNRDALLVADASPKDDRADGDNKPDESGVERRLSIAR